MTFLGREKEKHTIMAQTEWGWGGICQCSCWGSKVECKCLSLSNPTHFIFVAEKSVQGALTFFFFFFYKLSRCHLSEKRVKLHPLPQSFCRLNLSETCKVVACKEGTWQPVTSYSHSSWSSYPAESSLASLLWNCHANANALATIDEQWWTVTRSQRCWTHDCCPFWLRC